MNLHLVISVMISFLISVLAGPAMIPFLRKLKIGQTQREDGPSTHLKKSGTPTMGGIIFLSAILITSLFYIKDYPNIIPVVFLTIGFGVIGFVDDYIKVVKKQSMGLRPSQKMLGQFVVTGIFAFYLVRFTEVSLAMKIPFFSDKVIDLGIFNIPFLFLVVIATVNGTNFTDGLDGLAGSVTTAVASFFFVASASMQAGLEPVAGAVAGALMGFLMYNVFPAKVFMGDTGSLALGGFVAGIAYMMQMPIFILLIGIIYTVEVLSVFLQVSYFKATKGKRIFKMAPIHHHFELCGWSETRIVAVFTTVTILAGLVGLLAL